jgi:hypothetical protein
MIAAEEVIAALERSPSIVGPLVRQADPAIVKRRPRPGQWSIHEHACHLAEVHSLFSQRLDLMLLEDDPVIPSYDPGRDDPADALLDVDLAGALRRFEQDRGRLVQRLRRLRPADWIRTARHEEFNAYSVFIMFRHLALHDLSHAYQIEELLLRKDWPPPRPLPEGN